MRLANDNVDDNNNNDDDRLERNEIGIGIDLGTTNSAVAYLNDEGIPTIIPIPDNGRTMPSVVALLNNNNNNNNDDKSTVLVGHQALQYATRTQTQPYSHVKRVIGTGGKLSEAVQQVVPHVRVNPQGKTYKKQHLENQLYDAQHFPTLLHSTVVEPTPERMTTTTTTTKMLLRPETIATHVIRHLKHVAEQYASDAADAVVVTRAVVGIPAYFNDAQRAATIQATQAAGIAKVKLLREPEAAALAYGAGRQQALGKNKSDTDDKDELVLAFDLGGGTYDVSMLLVGGGVCEIICTAGNAQLGGADFDARIAQRLRQLVVANNNKNNNKNNDHKETLGSPDVQTVVVQAAEQIRIHLSNNREAVLDLPTTKQGWLDLQSPSDVIVKQKHNKADKDTTTTTTAGDEGNAKEESIQTTTTTLRCTFTRREMERLCKDEFQALLKPLREVAIMAGALLPGDTSPTLVEAALEMEEWSNYKETDDSLVFGDFYADEDTQEKKDEIDAGILLQLQQEGLKQAKRAQQKGRKRARDLSKEERKFRQQKREVAETSKITSLDGVKVQDGITGRPISRVVLVGGATRMPAVGRLIGALTGVTPQKTVNPDEAVALGCAANVGILDGVDGMGKVLSPMQAAILRAMAEQQGLLDQEIDDAEFGEAEYF